MNCHGLEAKFSIYVSQYNLHAFLAIYLLERKPKIDNIYSKALSNMVYYYLLCKIYSNFILFFFFFFFCIYFISKHIINCTKEISDLNLQYHYTTETIPQNISVLLGNTIITHCRPSHCIVRKRQRTATAILHQKDNKSKATSSLSSSMK